MVSPLSLVRTVARALRAGSGLPPNGALGQLVYRARDVGGGQDDCARLVLELADGRTVGDVVAAIYRHELRAGA